VKEENREVTIKIDPSLCKDTTDNILRTCMYWDCPEKPIWEFMLIMNAAGEGRELDEMELKAIEVGKDPQRVKEMLKEWIPMRDGRASKLKNWMYEKATQTMRYMPDCALDGAVALWLPRKYPWMSIACDNQQTSIGLIVCIEEEIVRPFIVTEDGAIEFNKEI